jgi:hypothetical protein
VLFERRPTPPRQIDLDGDQYREVAPRSEPGQPMFKKGGMRRLLMLIAIIVLTGLWKAWTYTPRMDYLPPAALSTKAPPPL